MKSNSVFLRIEKCKNSFFNPFCKSDAEIIDFIDDMKIQLWIIDSTMHLLQLEDKNISRHQKIISEHTLKQRDQIQADIVFFDQIHYSQSFSDNIFNDYEE